MGNACMTVDPKHSTLVVAVQLFSVISIIFPTKKLACKFIENIEFMWRYS
jgi:hypothetical protein